eukprot:scaffold9800_cov20-Cyclotella_meneghiniana.AAC.1
MAPSPTTPPLQNLKEHQSSSERTQTKATKKQTVSSCIAIAATMPDKKNRKNKKRRSEDTAQTD